MGQHSSSGRGGRHRQENLRRHRAPAFPALFATGSRTALSVTALSATLAAGIGAASMAASAAPIGVVSDGLSTAAHAPGTLPIVPPPGDEAPGKYDRPAPVQANAGPDAAPARRKTRPVPRAEWTHPNPSAQVTSCFGQRWGRLHAGVDLIARTGTPIHAVAAGIVLSAHCSSAFCDRPGSIGLSGCGWTVNVNHGGGIVTRYCHAVRVNVQAGQHVAAGTVLGWVGSTGNSSGPHLHFEVHLGNDRSSAGAVDPVRFM